MNKLPLHIKFSHNYDPLRMQEELNSCLKHEWPLHFNTSDFEGSWKSISLRSASGVVEDLFEHPEINGYRDTPLLVKTPYIKSIIDSWKCDKEAVRLLSLAPGSVIKPHKTDRLENIARLGNIADQVSNEYDFILIAAINPFEEGRRKLSV